MIYRLVRMHFQESFVDQFRDLFQVRKPHILNFPGCVSLELYQDEKNPCIWYTWSCWKNAEALELYRQSALFKSTWQEVKPQFAAPPQAFTLRPENE